MEARLLADLAVRTAQEKKARDIIVLDLRPSTLVCDYFVICTVTTSLQGRAVADHLEEKLPERLRHREGYREGRWILLDYGAVVIHVFREEERRFYDLERLWAPPERERPAQVE